MTLHGGHSPHELQAGWTQEQGSAGVCIWQLPGRQDLNERCTALRWPHEFVQRHLVRVLDEANIWAGRWPNRADRDHEVNFTLAMHACCLISIL